MNDFRRESFLLTHAPTSRLSGFRVAKATRNLPAIRWLYVIYQYIRWVKKSTSFQFCAANLQKLFQTTIIPPPHFQIFLSRLTLLRAPTRGRIVSRQRSHPLHAPTATVNEHDTIRQAIGAVFFRRSRLFVLFHPTKPTNPTQPHQIKQLLSKIAVNERAVVPGFNFTGFFAAIKRKIVTLWYGYTLHISAYHSAHLYALVGILCRHGNRLCVGE